MLVTLAWIFGNILRALGDHLQSLSLQHHYWVAVSDTSSSEINTAVTVDTFAAFADFTMDR